MKVLRLRVVGVVAALAALTSGAAQAKGPNAAAVCGASGCTRLTGESAVAPLLSWTYTPFKPRAAPRPAPYYSIRVSDPSGIKWTLLYVPSRRMMRIWQSRVPPYSESIGPYWRVVPRPAVPQIAKAVARVRPYAAPKRWPR